MAKYKCVLCGWIYDPAVGDPDGGIEPAEIISILFEQES